MPNTSEGFYYPDANTNIAPLETVLANMAASSDSVAQQTPRVFANYAAMVAGIPSPVGGRLAITTQGSGILWQYDGTAAKWVVQNRPTFSGATARDAAIPFPTAGIAVVISTGSNSAEYVWNGTVWRPSGVHTRGRATLSADTPLGAEWTTLLSTTPLMLAGPAVLTATGWIGNGDSGAQRTATVQLTRDGTDVGIPHNYVLPNVVGATVGQPIAITVETPAEIAGSHTYTIKVRASAASAVVVRAGTRIAVTQGDPGLS